MLTRRENLLVRPWQQRRFHHHRKKVESALPVIDVGPPAERGHVTCKLKQVQNEGERCAQIGRDNCALVLRLAHIMRTSRVDNGWRQPPPTFLRRVGIYLDPATPFPPGSRPRTPRTPRTGCRTPLGSAASTVDGEALDGEVEGSQDSEGRNLSCSACHPRTARRKERHRELAGRPVSSAGAAPATAPPPRRPSPRSAPPRPVTASAAAGRKPHHSTVPLDQVVITYKALRLAISFPPHASVRIRSASAANAHHNQHERRGVLQSAAQVGATA